jgi:hypothetical protein
MFRRRTRVVPEPAPLVDDPDWVPDETDETDLEDQFCCSCGHLLGDDPEDEIDGEGPGRDICGNCNRGRNQDAMTEVHFRGDMSMF